MPAARRSSSEGGSLLGDRRLAVRRLVLVDDTLGGCLVQLAVRFATSGDGGVLVAGLGELTELAHSGLQGGLDGLVALVRRLLLAVALDLGLDVRHVAAISLGLDLSGGIL